MESRQENQLVAKLIYDSEFRAKYMKKMRGSYFSDEICRIQFNILLMLKRDRVGIDYENVKVEFDRQGIEIPSVTDIQNGVNYNSLVATFVGEGYRDYVQAEIGKLLKHENPKKFIKALEVFKNNITKRSLSDYSVFEGAEIIEEYKRLDEKGVQVVGWTGIEELDNLLGGLTAGKIHSVLASPNVGKTMFTIQSLIESVKKGSRVLYISTEANLYDVVTRSIVRETNWNLKQMKRKDYPLPIETKKLALLNEYEELFREKKTVIVEGITKLDDILAVMENTQYVRPIDYVIIDHVHNIRTKHSNIFDRISTIAHELQGFANANNVGIMLAGQMSKSDVRDDKLEIKTAKGGMDIEEVSENMFILQRDLFGEDKSTMDILIKKSKDIESSVVSCVVDFPSMIIRSVGMTEYTETSNPTEKLDVLDILESL